MSKKTNSNQLFDYFMFDEFTNSLIPKIRQCFICNDITDDYKYFSHSPDKRFKRNKGKPDVECYICNSCFKKEIGMEWEDDVLKVIILSDEDIVERMMSRGKTK